MKFKRQIPGQSGGFSHNGGSSCYGRKKQDSNELTLASSKSGLAQAAGRHVPNSKRFPRLHFGSRSCSFLLALKTLIFTVSFK